MSTAAVAILVIVNIFAQCESFSVRNNAGEGKDQERLNYAIKMISYMNTSVDPCEDFYEYACGNYFNVNKPKPSIGIQSALLNIENQEIEDFREILMQPLNGQDDPTDKAKQAYQACMKANIFDYKKSDAYLKVVKSLGGWPALDLDWKPENFDWFHIMTTLRQYGVNFMIAEEIKTDRDMFLVEIKPDMFGLVEILEEDLNRTTSKPYVTNKRIAHKLMEMYGIPKHRARKAFEEMLEFGELVAIDEGGKLAMDLSVVAASVIPISNLTKEAPKIDWEKYFTTVSGAPVNTSQESIFISTLPILANIPNSFVNKTESVIRGAANYAVLKLLYTFHQELKSKTYPERFCFFHIQKYLSSAASALYLQSQARFKEGEDEAWTVISYAREAFKDRINKLDWLDDESKQRTISKVDNMKVYIGYSNYSFQLDDLRKEYSGLELEDDYYGNNVKLRMHYQRNLHTPLVTNVVDNDRYILPLLIDLNAFYSFSNKLIIPAVLLVKPYAYPELPKAYNFGSIGRTIGHEMVHGFDSMGRVYNEFAEAEQWWSNDSIAAYEQRENCLEKQYSEIQIPELNIKVNGEDTIQENIADNGGIRQIYYGYQKWLKDNEGNIDLQTEILPALNMTNKQLLFLSFGQMFCTRYNNRKAYKLYTEGTYTVEKYRLIGTLSNFEEFSQNFNCKVGSRMNPEKKCILW